ncbi:hypothetical protein GCM10009560_63150 [Nonomuraea longicatena]|uniref:Uncharacterized protein n=1 Tax=Nonomuraea longicatena TaxID=83682 RepID=A0ABP4BCT1_9ACTN
MSGQPFSATGNPERAFVRDALLRIMMLGISRGRALATSEVSPAAVLVVLQERGFTVTEATKDRIVEQTDPKRLERILRQAVTITSIQELFHQVY